jgi:hypothetical protein
MIDGRISAAPTSFQVGYFVWKFNQPGSNRNMKNALGRVLTAVISAGVLGHAATAHAGLFRAYLSLNGNDANACTLPAPCRLLPAALNAINNGGEIWMLDSANFNTATVNITKSATILAVPGALGSVVANGGDAILINAPGINVTLRNLIVLNLSGGVPGPSGLNGIRMFDGAGLTIEDCEVYGMTGRGLAVFATGPKVTVRRSVFRDNAFRGVTFSGPMTVTIDGVHVLNSPLGVIAGPGNDMTISNSVIAGGTDGAGGGVGIKAQTDATATVNLAIESSVIRSSDTGIGVTSDGGATLVTISRSSISQNNTGLLTALSAGAAVAVLNGSTVSHNGTAGVDTTGGGGVQTMGNNVFQFNHVNVNGTLTPLGAL